MAHGRSPRTPYNEAQKMAAPVSSPIRATIIGHLPLFQ